MFRPVVVPTDEEVANELNNTQEAMLYMQTLFQVYDEMICSKLMSYLIGYNTEMQTDITEEIIQMMNDYGKILYERYI